MGVFALNTVPGLPVLPIIGKIIPWFAKYTKDPTGFTDPEKVVVTGNPTDKTVTLTGTVVALWRGKKVATLVSGYVSPAHGTDTSKVYYLSYDGSTISWADSLWTFDKLHIAIAFYDATMASWVYQRECHGFMPKDCHESDHFNKGAWKESWAGLSSYLANSTTAGDRRPAIGELDMHDEDLPTINTAVTNDSFTQMTLTSTGTATMTTAQAEIVPVLTANPYYNSFSTPNWSQTLMPANSVASVWLVALPMAADTDSQKLRFFWVQPQWITQAQGPAAGQLATALATELTKTIGGVSFGSLTALTNEMLPISRVVIQYKSSDWTIVSVSDLNGNRYQQTQTPAGNFLSAVSTDATLTGSGTVADPLTVTQSYVLNTGNETVAGVKTFSSFPVTPSSAPTEDYQVANKKFVLDNAGSGGIDFLVAQVFS